MKTNPNGTRFSLYNSWSKQLNAPYDYERNGICNKTMSRKLWRSQNPFLQYMIDFVDKSLIFCRTTAQKLEHFFNYNFYNR